MSEDEAREILKQSGEYVYFAKDRETVDLDGSYTHTQLRAVLFLMRPTRQELYDAAIARDKRDCGGL